MIDKTLSFFRSLMPNWLFKMGQPIYHYALSLLAAIWYRFPARHIKIVIITGTKGKSTTVAILSAVLEEAGFKIASSSTIESKIGPKIERNLYKMTTPGRFFLQRFLRQAVDTGCEYAIIEMTSQAVSQYRHKFIDLDAVIFTGIHPEHIDAHGSFENYLASKLELPKALERSPKRPRISIANIDDPFGERFLSFDIENNVGFRLSDWPNLKTKLRGDFNKMNIIAAVTYAVSQGVGNEAIRKAIEKFAGVPGRMEMIDSAKEKGFEIIIDYAHTTGSLEEVYKLFKDRNLIGVLGSCGGGRDKWKRPQMGKIAEKYCKKIFLTNEDPYDEDPQAIVGDILAGITDQKKVDVIMDRRKAIAKAFEYAYANKNDGNNQDTVVLITGKGTDPYIMGPRGSKEPWSDKRVAEEELAKLGKAT